MKKEILLILIILGIIGIPSCKKEGGLRLEKPNLDKSYLLSIDSTIKVLDSLWSINCINYHKVKWHSYEGGYVEFKYDTIIATIILPCGDNPDFNLHFGGPGEPDPEIVKDTCYYKYCLWTCEETLVWYVGEVNPGNPVAPNRFLDLIIIYYNGNPCYDDDPPTEDKEPEN